MEKLNSYKDYADNDYLFYKASLKEGYIYNAMASLAQGICEKYLKDIIDKFYVPTNNEENVGLKTVLHTHSLNKLEMFIYDHMPSLADDDLFEDILKADGYYFTSRYPGDESSFIGERDIKRCTIAVESAKSYNSKINLVKAKDQNIEHNSNPHRFHR